jgi:hypothetical protein
MAAHVSGLGLAGDGASIMHDPAQLAGSSDDGSPSRQMRPGPRTHRFGPTQDQPLDDMLLRIGVYCYMGREWEFPQVQLEVPLSAGLALHADLASALLQHIAKLLHFSRGQAVQPFDSLREGLQAALQALRSASTGEVRCKLRRLRAPSALRRLVKVKPRLASTLRTCPAAGLAPNQQTRPTQFAASMEALLASLGPGALHAAQPCCVLLAFGPSLSRPRELYRISFLDADTGRPAFIAPASASVAPDTELCDTVQAAALADTAAAPPPTPPCGPVLSTRCLLPERNSGLDACAALPEREQRAVRRAVRSLVVAQPSVPAWAQVLREWRWAGCQMSTRPLRASWLAVRREGHHHSARPPVSGPTKMFAALAAAQPEEGAAAGAAPGPPLVAPGPGLRLCSHLPFHPHRELAASSSGGSGIGLRRAPLEVCPSEATALARPQQPGQSAGLSSYPASRRQPCAPY